MRKRITIGSRDSQLAVIQSMTLVDHLRKAYPECDVELLTMKTTGDKILDRTLDQVGGKGLFVKELDLALRDHRADLTVHSLKDMPMEISEDLPLLCFSHREDPRDVLILPKGSAELAHDAVIGTSSLRRQLQLKSIFQKHEIKSVRGNLQTRLRKLDEGEYGALVLAAAGLKRLGLEDRIFRYFTVEEIIPAAGQGILGVQGRKGEDHSYLSDYGDENSFAAATAERAFVRALNGGCTSPVCAYAEIMDEQIVLLGLYYNEENGILRRGKAKGPIDDAEKIGICLAAELSGRKEVHT